MKKYIDAEALIKALIVDQEECPGCPEPEALKEFIAILDEAPAADVQEVRHGRWIKGQYMSDIDSCLYNEYTCSVCGTKELNKYPYCRNCGASMMDEVEDDGSNH